MLLSGAADPNVVKIITFINSKSATMFSAFHRFLVLELNSDSSKNQNQLSENQLLENIFFDGPFSDSRYPRWVKPGANRFFFCLGSENYFTGRWLVNSVEIIVILLFMRKILFFCQIEKKRENGITKIGNPEFWTNFETKC